MKLRDLIKELVNHDMDSDVTVHAANGTRLLDIAGFHDHKERTVGDSDEPRLTLLCYKSQEPSEANKVAHGLERERDEARAQVERVRTELASALWDCSTLRHGLFTPNEFPEICQRVIAELLEPNAKGQAAGPVDPKN